MDALIILFSFAFLVLLILGFIGLFNPSAFKMKSKLQSSLIFFGSSLVCLIIFVVLINAQTALQNASANSQQVAQETNSIAQTNQVDSPSVVSEVTNIEQTAEPEIEYVDAFEVGHAFNSLTELQRDEWNKTNKMQINTKGSCIVAQVSTTNWASTVQNADYEVECEIDGSVKPVVYFNKEYSDLVNGLNIGDTLNYVGVVHSAQNFGFWTSVYIVGN